jgi:hypothetical protein
MATFTEPIKIATTIGKVQNFISISEMRGLKWLAALFNAPWSILDDRQMS